MSWTIDVTKVSPEMKIKVMKNINKDFIIVLKDLEQAFVKWNIEYEKNRNPINNLTDNELIKDFNFFTKDIENSNLSKESDFSKQYYEQIKKMIISEVEHQIWMNEHKTNSNWFSVKGLFGKIIYSSKKEREKY